MHAAYRGIYQLDPVIVNKVLAALYPLPSALTPSAVPPAAVNPTQLTKLIGLTSREIEVLRLIAHGATNREIAQKLVISEGTVKNHISSILSRLGLRDRTQAAIYARENSLF